MPLAMRVGSKKSDVEGELDDEHLQNVFMSWLNYDRSGVEVLRSIEKNHKVDLGPLRKQSSAIYDVEEYMANADCSEEDAEEAVARSKAAWQPPKPLLEALVAFRACVEKSGIDVESTSFSVEDHLEAIDELTHRVEIAIEKKASQVCLEADAFLM